MEMRAAIKEREGQQKMKSKMREKLHPKMGKIDVDYQKLHDAFFKYQTKPEMSIHGDLYYEGKEWEVRYKNKRPGNLSEELKVGDGGVGDLKNLTSITLRLRLTCRLGHRPRGSLICNGLDLRLRIPS